MTRGRSFPELIRVCFACGTEKTTLNKNNNPIWLINPPIGVLCQNCASTLIRGDRNRERARKYYEKNRQKKIEYERQTRDAKKEGEYNRRTRMRFKERGQIHVKVDYRNPCNIHYGFRFVDIHCDVCSFCRAVMLMDCKRTDLHHEAYHDENPLMDTIELCERCHPRESIKLEQLPQCRSMSIRLNS